jgi:hypothetical protein
MVIIDRVCIYNTRYRTTPPPAEPCDKKGALWLAFDPNGAALRAAAKIIMIMPGPERRLEAASRVARWQANDFEAAEVLGETELLVSHRWSRQGTPGGSCGYAIQEGGSSRKAAVARRERTVLRTTGGRVQLALSCFSFISAVESQTVDCPADIGSTSSVV